MKNIFFLLTVSAFSGTSSYGPRDSFDIFDILDYALFLPGQDVNFLVT